MTSVLATPAAIATPHNRIRVGYARVSTRGQDHQAQLDALTAAHCREVVVETASTRGERPKLRATLDRLQAGDTLVIYKPDRVARSIARARLARGESVTAIAAHLGVGLSTLYRALDTAGNPTPAVPGQSTAETSGSRSGR